MNNGENLTLPVVFPDINAYPHQGILFSILFAREDCLPWIFSNFIQTYTLKNLYANKERSGTVDFFNSLYGDWRNFFIKANPWIQLQTFSMEWLIDKSIVDILKKYLQQGKYCFFDVDMFYISAYKKVYHKEHMYHDIFIYGYNDVEKYFYFGDNTVGKYCFDIVFYSELEESTKNILKDYYEIKDNSHDYREKLMYIIEVKKNSERSNGNKVFDKEIYGLNINKIINDIKEYLLFPCYGESYKFSDFYVYGINCFDELINYIYMANKECSEIDIRGFYSFGEHKKLMLFRIKYLQNSYGDEFNYLLSEYEEIVYNYKNIIFKIIRNNIQKNEKLSNIIIKNLYAIKKKEKNILINLIEKLKLLKYDN